MSVLKALMAAINSATTPWAVISVTVSLDMRWTIPSHVLVCQPLENNSVGQYIIILLVHASSIDTDECAQGTHSCDPTLASCSNTEGSFECSCLSGFEGEGYSSTCDGICAKWALWIIVLRYYLYSADVDECISELDNCHNNASCTNTFGDYNCSCYDGFTGDGFTCSGTRVHLQL